MLWSIIVLLLLLYTIHFGEGHTGISCMCYPIFMQGIICEKAFRSFQDVKILTYSNTHCPSRTSIGSTKCHHLFEVSCMMSYFLEGGGKFYRHQPREWHYIHCGTWYIWLLCSVVGRIAAILMYVLLDRYYDARKRYSRQVQSVWESSDAGVFVKYLLGHTSLLL